MLLPLLTGEVTVTCLPDQGAQFPDARTGEQ
jgi:hypothetical protein